MTYESKFNRIVQQLKEKQPLWKLIEIIGYHKIKVKLLKCGCELVIPRAAIYRKTLSYSNGLCPTHAGLFTFHTLEEFKSTFAPKYPEFDFSQVTEYKNNETKYPIIHKFCGRVYMRSYNDLRSQHLRCAYCDDSVRTDNKDILLARVAKRRPNFDFTYATYHSATTPITNIRCRVCNNSFDSASIIRWGIKCSSCESKRLFDTHVASMRSKYTWIDFDRYPYGHNMKHKVVCKFCGDSYVVNLRSHSECATCKNCESNALANNTYIEYLAERLPHLDFSGAVYISKNKHIFVTCRKCGSRMGLMPRLELLCECPACEPNGKYTKMLTTTLDRLHKKRPWASFTHLGRRRFLCVCKTCGSERVLLSSNALKGTLECYNCTSRFQSQGEREVSEFIQSFYSGQLIRRDRRAIKRELDIYLPELNLAIEFNGTYWHNPQMLKSNRGVKHPETYHLEKSRLCLTSGINLIHIFSDEWSNNSDEVKRFLQETIANGEPNYKLHPNTILSIHRYPQLLHVGRNITQPKLLKNSCFDCGSAVYTNNQTQKDAQQ